ncbi:MAG: FGGY-family carbohydrate kinase, partial [Clostridia bacterium]|nr:FGGY-family carbohydrate kinase [Clostridia bacterium]
HDRISLNSFINKGVKQMAVIGLDVGTTGVKSTVFGSDWQVFSHAYREYNLIGEAEGKFELDPEILWQKAKEVIRESAAECPETIDAISVTSFGESFVCLDENDNVLCKTMIYMDKRGQRECEEYRATRDEREVFSHCGQFIDPMFALYKLRWMRNNAPQVLEKTKKLCFIADFMTYMMGAGHCCDYSLAARSAMFDVFEKRWIDDAVAFSTIDPAALPDVAPSGSVVGGVSAGIARELGVSEGARLIVGGHDQILAALGSGAWEAGDIANGMGTVDCITAVMSADKLDIDALMTYSFPIVPFMDTGRYVTYAFNMSGGCVVKWFRDNMAADVSGRNDAYDILGSETPAEPTGILMLPYLAGAGTPYMDADTPAAIYGLRLGTSRGKLFKAFLEGESYEMMVNIECLTDVGIDVRKIITVGGGSNSSVWMQIRADVFDRPVYLPRNKEAGTLASAILCLAGTGKYKTVREAQDAMISYDRRFDPQPGRVALYKANFERYKRFYGLMREFASK